LGAGELSGGGDVGGDVVEFAVQGLAGGADLVEGLVLGELSGGH
jgi:hypothetical protein